MSRRASPDYRKLDAPLEALPLFGGETPVAPTAPAGAPDKPNRQRQVAPYQVHSPTSRAAAVAGVATGRFASLERRAFDAFEAAGDAGLTDEELDARLGVERTVRPRRVALWQAGYVYRRPVGTRPTSSGREAAVWVWSGKAYAAPGPAR
jgi:hypothetical protein